jgi:hypothetical protein
MENLIQALTNTRIELSDQMATHHPTRGRDGGVTIDSSASMRMADGDVVVVRRDDLRELIQAASVNLADRQTAARRLAELNANLTPKHPPLHHPMRDDLEHDLESV